jgi:hypothetical protein
MLHNTRRYYDCWTCNIPKDIMFRNLDLFLPSDPLKIMSVKLALSKVPNWASVSATLIGKGCRLKVENLTNSESRNFF